MPKRIADAAEAWRSWEAEHDVYDGRHRELVRLSSRVLKGLTYRPTGAIVAAPTTPLPETAGGERNWDYRFSWIRDSSLTIEALYIGACSDEAGEFVSFGELLNCLWLYRDRLGDLHREIQAFVADLADTAARRWTEADSGMWEMRGEPRHHLANAELLGNFPQAFTHIGLITATYELNKARGETT